MSFVISLVGEHEKPVEVAKHTEGCNCEIDGTTATMGITYNYSRFYWTVDREKGLAWLYGKKASECIPRLKEVVAVLGTGQNADYWASTPGNAGYALSVLLKWAEQYPDAEFRGG